MSRINCSDVDFFAIVYATTEVTLITMNMVFTLPLERNYAA